MKVVPKQQLPPQGPGGRTQATQIDIAQRIEQAKGGAPNFAKVPKA